MADPRRRRRLAVLWLLVGCVGCEPDSGGASVGPLESWFRGPGPAEYLTALAVRDGALVRDSGALTDVDGRWHAALAEGRVLRIDETRGDSLPTLQFVYYGDGTLAAIRAERVADDTLRWAVALDFANDSVWRHARRRDTTLGRPLRVPQPMDSGWTDSVPSAWRASLVTLARRRLAHVDSVRTAARATRDSTPTTPPAPAPVP